MKLDAGEFAAAEVREESEAKLATVEQAHQEAMERVQAEAAAAQAATKAKLDELQAALIQKDEDTTSLEFKVSVLCQHFVDQQRAKLDRDSNMLEVGLAVGVGVYRRLRWLLVFLFASVVSWTTSVATDWPALVQVASFLLTAFGFWFAPEVLERPVRVLAMRELRTAVRRADASLHIPADVPDFRSEQWTGLELLRAQLRTPQPLHRGHVDTVQQPMQLLGR